MHVQSKYAIDLTEARRVVADHDQARVITVGAEGLRATYGFFLLEDSEAGTKSWPGTSRGPIHSARTSRLGCRRC